MRKEFCRYIFPAMFSFMLTGIYSIVDGIFVGNAVGDNGLAAINIVWPLAALIISLGTGIGMGASVIVSLNRGAGNERKAKQAEGNAFFLIFVGTLLLVIALGLTHPFLLRIMGAEGIIFTYCQQYIRVLLMGSIAQISATALLPLIRNHGASIFAMIAMALGCITNIVLDWVYVFEFSWGIWGAAFATVCGQVLTLILCIGFFARKSRRDVIHYLKPDAGLIRSILKVGVSPFGLTYLPSITIIFMNLQTLKYGGTPAVSAYAILAYILSFMELLIQGISDGSQPLLSLSRGSGKIKELKTYRKWMFLLALGFGAVSGIVTVALQDQIPVLFGGSKEAAVYIADSTLPIGIALLLYGFSKPAISYFYAINQTTPSSIMVYGEVALTVGLIYLLPLAFGLMGVWYTMPLVQLLLSLIGVFFLKRQPVQNLPRISEQMTEA